MAFHVIYVGGILFFVCMLSIEKLTASASVVTPKPDPAADKIKHDNFYNYLASGFDLTTATLDDLNDTEGLKKKKRIWKIDSKTKSSNDAYSNRTIVYPKFLTCINVKKDENLDISVQIYNVMDDLEGLLVPATDKETKTHIFLRHKLELFENRFRETTLPKARVVNGLVN